MAQEPWGPQYGPPSPEQKAYNELGPFEEQFGYPHPNFLSGPTSAPAPGNVSATGYGEHAPDDYFPDVGQSGPFIPSPHPATFSMLPNITSSTPWNPTCPDLPASSSDFHQHVLPTPAPPTDWHVSNASPLLRSDPYVPTQTAGFEQMPHVLPSSYGSGPAANPTGAYPGQSFGVAGTISPEGAHQQHSQAVSRSILGHCSGSFLQRYFLHLPHLPHLGRSTTQSIEACWKCKGSHTKCDEGTPCQRCQTSSGSSAIPCHRGQVSDPAAELPFPCHLSLGVKRLEVQQLPPALQPAAKLLQHARQRRRKKVASIKEGIDVGNHDILCKVVNTEVPYIRSFNPLAEFDLYTALELPYDELIVNIVWELKDNPEAATLAGIGAVEDLVALLEAASLCESQFGHHDKKRRLVYSSMNCLFHCMEALRLSSHGLLTTTAHEHCAQANECICPAFHGLTRYAPRYTEALTMAMFHKKKHKGSNWLLVFYSLCIQSHVRCALMSIEQRLRSAELSSAGMEVVDHIPSLSSAKYLHRAVSLFEQLSMQNRGKLAKKVRNSQAKPSVYLQHPLHSPSARPGGSSSWQAWRSEGIPEYLGRVFQIPNEFTLLSPLGNDLDVTMSSSPLAKTMTAVAAARVNNAGGHYAPSVIGSTWSATSRGDSDIWTLGGGLVTPSAASFAGSSNLSTISLRTVTADEERFNYDRALQHNFRF